MITKRVIDELYKKYDRRPAGVEDLDIGLLFDYAADHHDISIDEEGYLVIESIGDDSPFRRLPLRGVHAIVPFEDVVAIVMHSSIVFLSKHGSEVNVHVRLDGPSLWERVKTVFAGKPIMVVA